MPSSQSVIVVGAGIVGASIAWHLTHKGAAVTIVAEKNGGEATPNSFAWINASWGNPEFYFYFRQRSMAEWARLATEVRGMPLAWCGGLCWDLPAEELEDYAHRNGGWGYGMQRVDRQMAAIIEPNLLAPPEFALHVPEEGAVEPVSAANLLLADAIRHGAVLLADRKVTRLSHGSARVSGVETDRGPLTADHVVLAAGGGSVALAASVDVDIPLKSPPGLIVHSRPCGKLLNGLVLAPELHMRQTAEGRIIAGSDFGGTDPGDAPVEAAKELFAKVKAMLRHDSALELDFHTVGHRPTPVDGFPIIGGANDRPGLYLAVMHSGVTLAPLVGLLAAQEILGLREDAQLVPFRPSRFSPRRQTAE